MSAFGDKNKMSAFGDKIHSQTACRFENSRKSLAKLSIFET